MRKPIIFIVALFAALWAGSPAAAAIIVGRISHVEGNIYRYMDVDDNWVATQLQSPAGIEDALATGPDSRAEITFPNYLLLRLDENTEIDILELDDDLGVFVLNSGLARFYNRSGSGKAVIETSRGTVTVPPGSVIDMQADGRNVVVSAVEGEATFQSIQNGEERLEVISGATSLAFREESIEAGTGPINWNWDKWCGVREGAWAQNRLVRSEYLPESMQLYACEIEPYGSWSRIYYGGYYYWAWKPRFVAVGWSPYTTGYWYDWRDSPVWIDHNPWGWVTHHHGNWIHVQGSWMWTPYVHVSHVPGVTVVGFNITFGKTYRPHWHPGRVRWISHNDYIGWFPLAPRETYYGYRRWGPGSVLVRGGSGFSLSINLSQHRHIDHAVIIPNRHLHKKGPVVVNNYNTVRITTINKRVIVKDYKPLVTAERERTRTHRVARSAPGGNAARRSTSWVQPDRKRNGAAGIAGQLKPEKRDDRVIRIQRDVKQQKMVEMSVPGSSKKAVTREPTKIVARNRQYSAARTEQRKVPKIEQGVPRAKIQKQGKPLQRKSLAARLSPEKAVEKKAARLEPQAPVSKIQKQKNLLQRKNLAARVPSPRITRVAREDRVQKQTRESLQASIKTGSRSKVTKNNTTVAGRSDTRKGKQDQREVTTQAQRQAALNDEGAKRTALRNDRKSPVSKEREEKKTPQQKVRNQNNAGGRNGFRDKSDDRQEPGSGRFWSSMNNRRLQ